MAAGLLAPSPHFNNPILSSASVLGTARFNNLRNYASARDTSKSNLNRVKVSAIKEKTEEIKTPSSSSSSSSSAEEVTQKYGLEAGLWKVPI